MQVSQETINQANVLMAACFDFNAFLDNCAYNLAYSLYPNMEKILHEGYAHEMPVLADKVFAIIDKVGARAVRKPINSYEKDYQGNLVELFGDIAIKSEEFRKEIIKTIDMAELNEDYEMKIEFEDFLEDYMPFYKQFEDWSTLAKRYQGHESTFDIRFDRYIVSKE